MTNLNSILKNILLETKALQRAKEIHKLNRPSKLPLHINITVKDNQELYLLLSQLESEGFNWHLNTGITKPLVAIGEIEKDFHGFNTSGWMKDREFPMWIRLGNDKKILSWNPDSVGDVYLSDLETQIEKKYDLYNTMWNIGTHTKIGIKTNGERIALLKFLKEYYFFHRNEGGISGITEVALEAISNLSFPFYIMLDLKQHFIMGYGECKDWEIDLEFSDLEVK